MVMREMMTIKTNDYEAVGVIVKKRNVHSSKLLRCCVCEKVFLTVLELLKERSRRKC